MRLGIFGFFVKLERRIDNSEICDNGRNRCMSILFGKTDNTLIQMFRTMVAGFAAFGTDFFLLWALTDIAGVYYLLSAAISALVGGLLTYVLSSVWVFHKKEKGSIFVRFLIFTAIGAGGLGINLFVMWVLTDLVGVYYLFSKVLSQSLAFLFNFFCRKFFVFEADIVNAG